MDLEPARARSLVNRYKAAYATTDAQEIIDDPKIDLVFVASNHASHAPYAVAALDAGKDVHYREAACSHPAAACRFVGGDEA